MMNQLEQLSTMGGVAGIKPSPLNFGQNIQPQYGPIAQKPEKFPGLREDQVQWIEDKTANLPEMEKLQVQQEIYQKVYPKVIAKQMNEGRLQVKNELFSKAMNDQNPAEQKRKMAYLRLENFSDILKEKYHLKPTLSTDKTIEGWYKIMQQRNIDKSVFEDYLNGKNEDIYDIIGYQKPTLPTEYEGGTKGLLSREGSGWGKLEWLNPIGATAEVIDDLAQKIPTIDITKTREENLNNRLNNLTEQEIANYRKKWEAMKNDPSFAGYLKNELRGLYTTTVEGDTLVEQLRNGITGNTKQDDEAGFRAWVEAQEKSFVDNMLGVGEEGPNVLNMIGNIPSSAVKTVSALGRAFTNPLDTLNGIRKIVSTEEGRQAIIHRYGTWEGFEEAMETDPVGVASDVLAVAEGGAGLVGRGAKIAGLTKTADNLSSFAKTAGGASDLGIRNLQSLGMGKLGELSNSSNKLVRGGATYLEATQNPMKVIGKAGKGIKNTANKGLDWLDEQKTGLTKIEKKGIQNNPYQAEYWKDAQDFIEKNGQPAKLEDLISQPLEELSSRATNHIQEIRNSLSDSGPLYNKVREIKTPIDVSNINGNINDVLKKYKIKVGKKGKLNFTQSKYSQPADMNSIQAIYNRIQDNIKKPMDVETILNLRKAVDNALKREGAPTNNRDILLKMRKVVDETAKAQIPELKQLDDYYSREIKYLNEIEEGLIYRQGDRKGKFRDNIQQIMKTLNNPNRAEMRKRLITLMPDLPERIEAITNIPKLVKAYTSLPKGYERLPKSALVGVPSLVGYNIGGMGGALVGGAIGYILDGMVGNVRKESINKVISNLSPEAKSRLGEINEALLNNQELRASEKDLLDGIKKKLQEYSEDRVDIPDGPQGKGNVVFSKVNTNRDIFKSYQKEHGNIVNPDNFRKYVDEGGKLPASQTHEPASALSQEYFEHLLSKTKKGDKAMIIAGGPGSGKGTSLKKLGLDNNDYKIIVDKTKGTKELKSMLDKGLKVDYYAVISNPENAISQIVGRASRNGRTLPINKYGIPNHIEVIDTLNKLKNNKNINFKTIDNRGTIQDIKFIKKMEDLNKILKESKKAFKTTDKTKAIDLIDKARKKFPLSEAKYKELIASLGLFVLFFGNED